MAGFAKLDSNILYSSIWCAPLATRIVWISFLAKANRRGFVRAARQAMVRISNVSEQQFDEAAKYLESPDPDSRHTEHGGRRIKKVDGGWEILNYLLYRDRNSDVWDESDPPRDGYVYFAGDGARIKIGFSLNPWARVQEMKTANPDIALLGSRKGTREDETLLHDMFKGDNIAREWFRPSERLLQKIEEMIGKRPLISNSSATVATNSSDVSASASASVSASVSASAKKEKPLWKRSFLAYKVEHDAAYAMLRQDSAWVAKRQRFHPHLDILLSMEKAATEYWGIEAGWKRKKRATEETIDWPATYINALTMRSNQVWLPREQQAVSNPQSLMTEKDQLG